ncbi:hypothetical protein DM02DRAFT_505314, partial [Periconia macrospinosa]
LPTHYQLPPTVPSPFEGTLVNSLDAILVFGSKYRELKKLTEPLLAKVNHNTNWLDLFHSVLYAHRKRPLDGRKLLEEFLFLITRTLLPEQIAENRMFMFNLYSLRRNNSTRLSLRYDMLRDWKKVSSSQWLVVDSKLPEKSHFAPPPPPVPNPRYPNRRPLMPNVITTLIAPHIREGYITKKLADCMRHHVTELDNFLLLTDGTVEGWSTGMLLTKLGAAVSHWQWLRESNEVFEDMEVNGYPELERKAEDCDWVRE